MKKQPLILASMAAALTWALVKVNNLINAGKKIKINRPQVYALRVDLSNQTINFKIDIDIINPSKETFTIKPQFVDIFTMDEKFLARATAKKVTFNLPPQSTRTIKQTTVQIPTQSLPDLIFSSLLEQQLIADVNIQVNGIDLNLTQLIKYKLSDF